MLVTRRGDRLTLVTHPDHGRLAGQLAPRWGNERFAAVAPRTALITAATHHDDGWAELDNRPAYNADAGRPAHFLELALPDTVGPYGRGVDTVYARDPHAGALVSMHWAGLYRTRWGQQGGSAVGHPVAAEIVTEQERRWTAALREVWAYEGLRSEFEANTWHAYEVLQTLDFLALALSLLDLDRADHEGDAVAMPATLPLVDQPAGARLVPTAPLGPGRGHVDIRLSIAAPGRVALDPYPFADVEFEVRLPARELEDRRYGDEAGAAAYHAAAVREIVITVGPGS